MMSSGTDSLNARILYDLFFSLNKLTAEEAADLLLSPAVFYAVAIVLVFLFVDRNPDFT